MMKRTALLNVGLPMICFALASCASGKRRALNSSAMYAPPVITLEKGREYQLKEGKVRFKSDQRFYSQFELSRLLIINNLK